MPAQAYKLQKLADIDHDAKQLAALLTIAIWSHLPDQVVRRSNLQRAAQQQAEKLLETHGLKGKLDNRACTSLGGTANSLNTSMGGHMHGNFTSGNMESSRTCDQQADLPSASSTSLGSPLDAWVISCPGQLLRQLPGDAAQAGLGRASSRPQAGPQLVYSIGQAVDGLLRRHAL